MAGLSLILETRKAGVTEPTRQVINKATAMVTKNKNNPSSSLSSPPSSRRKNSQFHAHVFLDHCFLCGQKLLPGKDIFMYGGDKGFCSVECRCRQMFKDEEERILESCCCLAAMKPEDSGTNSSSSSSSSPPSVSRRHTKRGGFAY